MLMEVYLRTAALASNFRKKNRDFSVFDLWGVCEGPFATPPGLGAEDSSRATSDLLERSRTMYAAQG